MRIIHLDEPISYRLNDAKLVEEFNPYVKGLFDLKTIIEAILREPKKSQNILSKLLSMIT